MTMKIEEFINLIIVKFEYNFLFFNTPTRGKMQDVASLVVRYTILNGNKNDFNSLMKTNKVFYTACIKLAYLIVPSFIELIYMLEPTDLHKGSSMVLGYPFYSSLYDNRYRHYRIGFHMPEHGRYRFFINHRSDRSIIDIGEYRPIRNEIFKCAVYELKRIQTNKIYCSPRDTWRLISEKRKVPTDIIESQEYKEAILWKQFQAWLSIYQEYLKLEPTPEPYVDNLYNYLNCMFNYTSVNGSMEKLDRIKKLLSDGKATDYSGFKEMIQDNYGDAPIYESD